MVSENQILYPAARNVLAPCLYSELNLSFRSSQSLIITYYYYLQQMRVLKIFLEFDGLNQALQQKECKLMCSTEIPGNLFRQGGLGLSVRKKKK